MQEVLQDPDVRVTLLVPCCEGESQDFSVEVSDDNVLIVELEGVVLHQIQLEAQVDADHAKVKWSKARSTLTFIAPRKASSAQASIAASAVAGPDALAGEQGGWLNTNPNDEEEDTGLEEMYGAEMFAALKQEQPQQPQQPQHKQQQQQQRQQQQAPNTSSIVLAPPAQSNAASLIPTTGGVQDLTGSPSQLGPSQQPSQEPLRTHQRQRHRSLPLSQQQTLNNSQPCPSVQQDVRNEQVPPPPLVPQPPHDSYPAQSGKTDTMQLAHSSHATEMQQQKSGQVPEAQGIDCSTLAFGTEAVARKGGGGNGSSKAAAVKKAAKEERRRVAPILDSIADSLATRGWAVCNNYVPMDQVIEVRKEMKRLEEHFVEGEIWVGKEADTGATIARKDVRGDVVLWLNQADLEATAYIKDGEKHSCSFGNLRRVMSSIDGLVKEHLPSKAPCLANTRERSDAMMAIYPGRGSRFAKHIDNTANDGRRLTLLCYLNPNWKESNGGALRLTPPDGQTVDVYPQAGRLAMFLSKSVAHEVMPAYAPRHSFTLWYYDALERAEAVATAQVAGRGRASAAEQQEARDLIKDMLSRGGEIQATYEGVAALQRRVLSTSRASMGVVASIVGAPSTQAFLDAIEHMVPSELENLNDQLANMGQGDHAHAPTF